MTYVYPNIKVTQNLFIADNSQVSVGTTESHVVTSNKGDLLADNGNISVALPVGIDGQSLVARSSTSTGLQWENITLDNLNIVDTPTIVQTSPNTLIVNSGPVTGQALLSSAGGNGTEAQYGPIDLSVAPNIVTGTLGLGNGGTGNSGTFNADEIVVVDSSATSLVSSGVNINSIPSYLVGITSTSGTTPALIYTYTTVPSNSYYIQATFIGRNTADGTTASFKTSTTWTNTSGTLTLVDNAVDLVYVPYSTPWFVNFVSSGNDIQMIVNGSVGATVKWRVVINLVVTV